MKIIDRVKESTSTVGTGALALLGAVVGFGAFGSSMVDGDTCYYSAEGLNSGGGPSGEWETGIGTYNAAANTLSRTTVLASSNAGAAVVFSAGVKQVWIDVPAAFLNAPTFAGVTLGATPLVQDAANVLAQRSGVNPQAFRLYNTFTDASNYERAFIRFSTNDLWIGNEKAGTGSNRNLTLSCASGQISFMNGVTPYWQMNMGVSTRDLSPSTDVVSDIGKTAVRVRNLFMGGGLSLKTKAGAIVDGDFTNVQDGFIALDVTNSKLYARIGGAWKSVTLA